MREEGSLREVVREEGSLREVVREVVREAVRDSEGGRS